MFSQPYIAESDFFRNINFARIVSSNASNAAQVDLGIGRDSSYCTLANSRATIQKDGWYQIIFQMKVYFSFLAQGGAVRSDSFTLQTSTLTLADLSWSGNGTTGNWTNTSFQSSQYFSSGSALSGTNPSGSTAQTGLADAILYYSSIQYLLASDYVRPYCSLTSPTNGSSSAGGSGHLQIIKLS